MIKAVIDANVFASGTLGIDRMQSPPGAILRCWQRRQFELITSKALFLEIERTFRNEYFGANLGSVAAEAAIESLKKDATWTLISLDVTGIASHPEDDLVLATAVSAGADYLVTGDRQLQQLGEFQGVIIVSPRDFLTLLEDS